MLASRRWRRNNHLARVEGLNAVVFAQMALEQEQRARAERLNHRTRCS